MKPRPMRRWIRGVIVRVLRFAIRRKPDRVLGLRCGLERILRHRELAEIALIWHDACKGTWLERDNVAETWLKSE